MYIDFDTLPDTARVWVYQANRSLTDAEVTRMEGALRPALQQWAAHGQPLLASAKLVQNRFVVVGVDEGYTLPSGCSIDSSVRTVRQLADLADAGTETIDFFDRSAAIEQADGSVRTFSLPAIKPAVNEGAITSKTIVFNTLIGTKEQFQTEWRIPASVSWLKRYFKSATV